jgi:hypothetical protein
MHYTFHDLALASNNVLEVEIRSSKPVTKLEGKVRRSTRRRRSENVNIDQQSLECCQLVVCSFENFVVIYCFQGS